MAQRVKAPTALLKVMSSDPSKPYSGSQPPVTRSDALFWCVLKNLKKRALLILQRIRLSSQHPQGSSQLSVNVVSGDLETS